MVSLKIYQSWEQEMKNTFNFTLFFHMVLRYFLIVISLTSAATCLVTLLAAVFFSEYPTTMTESGSTIAFVLRALALYPVSIGAVSMLVSVITAAVALSYREPIHKLSHDALMEALPDIVTEAFLVAMSGFFSAVPRFRRLHEAHEFFARQFSSLRMEIAQVVGLLATTSLEITEEIDEEALRKLEHQLTVGETTQQEIKKRLLEIRARVTSLGHRVNRLAILDHENTNENNELQRALKVYLQTLESLAGDGQSNIVTIPGKRD